MRKIIFFTIFISLTLSCQKAKEDKTQGDEAFVNQRKAFFNALQEPDEVAAQLQATAAEFNAGLMNDPKKYEVYVSNEIKAAANLGIYMSDLNYTIAYKQREYSNAYFTAAHGLSTTLGVEKPILEFLVKRYEENIEKDDSVKMVALDLLMKSTRDFQGTKREKLAGVAMSAYMIENLHLVLGIIQSYPKDMLPDDARTIILIPLFKMVLNQRANVVIIYNFLKTYSDPLDPDQNPNYPYYTNAFEELIEVYKRLDVEQKIANNQALELMNDAVVKELSEKVNAIRDKIISVEWTTGRERESDEIPFFMSIDN